ncbi:hypothetical protein [Pseudactinotalea sp. HY160]|uniref:hypothetical protein n=1 Tax=Pseudactinotalea sp. HY160 TaxID=2654490 RepID=UPI001D132BBB|nr:hypothetical protein [Pseudactinotalea sp. HY160]
MSSLRLKHAALASLLTAGALALTACGSDAPAAASTGGSDDPIRIGVVTAAEDYWDTFTDLAAAEGISVEFVNFTDYQLPN